MSYSQIKERLGVSKSTLSYWLRKYPLSKQQIGILRDWNEQRIERFRETMRRKRELREQVFYREQRKLIFPLRARALYLAGIFLYWGEGSKTRRTGLALTNTDPSVILFFIHWLMQALHVSKNRLKVQLHLYHDMDIQREVRYWSRTLHIPIRQIGRPYIKKSTSGRINHKGEFGHGTCRVLVGNARLTEQVLMAISAVSDYYKERGA